MPRPMQPIDPREACAQLPDRDDPDCSVAGSQAALLLASRVGVLGVTGRELTDLEAAARRGGFGLPDLVALQRDRRLTVGQAQEPIGGDRRALVAASAPEVQAVMSVAAQALYRAPSARTAAALFEVGLLSPHPLVRVAAAAGASETTRPRPELLTILRAGVDARDSLVAAVARRALGALRPDDPALRAPTSPAPPGDPGADDRSAPESGHGPASGSGVGAADPDDPGEGAGAAPAPTDGRPDGALAGETGASSGAVLTHGTWGADGTWYRPGGELWTRLAAERPDLHVHDPSFAWSGGYTDEARREAATALRTWCTAQRLAVPDLFAHSHGGTVGNLATTDGLELGRLVYMAWPVHPQWYPDAARVRRVIDIRVTMDLVILVDRGGQRIRGAPFPVEEHVNGWFDHTSTHEPAYWDQHDLWGVV